jgi:upstream activation factor subunit UAF30
MEIESNTVEPQIVKEKKVRKSAPKKVKSENPVSEVVVENTVVEHSMDEPTVEQSFDNTGSGDMLNKLMNQFQDAQNLIKTMNVNLKVLQKEISKEKKSSKKNKVVKVENPVSITSEIAAFLNIDENTKILKKDVRVLISKYIKDHNLQNPENKKEILPNEDLTKLLQQKEGDVITYLNLHKYLEKYFIAEVVETVSTD